MKILCVFGKHQYGDPSRGLSTEYTCFIPALHHLGHQVAHFESWNTRHYHDLAELNGKLRDGLVISSLYHAHRAYGVRALAGDPGNHPRQGEMSQRSLGPQTIRGNTARYPDLRIIGITR